MKLPEFTAEKSLGRPSRSYHGRYLFGVHGWGIGVPLAFGQSGQSGMVQSAALAGASAIAEDDDVEIVESDALGAENGTQAAADGDNGTGDDDGIPGDSETPIEPEADG